MYDSGKADMFPKMTWGTPPPPQTPFTYPPYKRIGHMAVMGSPMALESKNMDMGVTEEARIDLDTPRGVTRDVASHLLVTELDVKLYVAYTPYLILLKSKAYNKSTPRSRQRSSDSASLTSSLDTMATSFPAREGWKLRTDTVKRQGGK